MDEEKDEQENKDAYTKRTADSWKVIRGTCAQHSRSFPMPQENITYTYRPVTSFHRRGVRFRQTLYLQKLLITSMNVIPP